MKVLVNNKKAYFDYEIIDKFQAGLVLKGWEVKSLKAFHGSLIGSYVRERDGEVFLIGSNIPMWRSAGFDIKDNPIRDRKLLMKKSEARNIFEKAKKTRLTVVPLQIIENDKGLIKVEIALVKGRKKFDKRAQIKKRDLSRSIEIDRKYFKL